MAQPTDYFNRIANTYLGQVNDEQRAARRRGLELLKPQPGERFLELGSGPGEDLRVLADLGVDVIGLDGAANMTKLANEYLREHQLAGEAVTARAPQGLGFEADTLDAVWASFTLEFLQLTELGETLRRLHRVLGPKGRICLVSLALTWPDLGAINKAAATWRDCFLESDKDALHWKLLMEDLGFEIERAEQAQLWGETVEIILATPSTQIQTIDIASSVAGLGSSKSTERIRCRQRLCTLGHLAVGPLEEQAIAGSELVRAEAAKCLHWIGATQSGPVLVKLLHDPSEKVRWIAAEGLIKIGDQCQIVSQLIRPHANAHRFYESAAHVIRELHRRGRDNLAPLAAAFDDAHPEVAIPVVAQRLHDDV